MTRRLQLIACIMLLHVLAPLCLAEPLTLIHDGVGQAVIVLPTETEHEIAGRTQGQDDEMFAAKELQSILEQITGVTLPIERAVPGAEIPGRAILIGVAHARASGAAHEIEQLIDDGLHVGVYDDKLMLTGRHARGSLFAVYDFLESLGCRWVMPGPFGELYPTLDTVTVEGRRSSNPSHTERYWWCTFGHAPEYELWTLRNKGDFIRRPGDPSVRQGHALAGPLRAAARNEAYLETTTQWVSREVEAEDGEIETVWEQQTVRGLPDDFYAIHNGKPVTHAPNMSNPRVWEMYADYYKAHFRNNPAERYVSMSAEDGIVEDERPESQRLGSNEIDWMLGAPAVTDKLWFFHNRVIEQVVEAFPDRRFGILVYANNMSPPRLEPVHPNMALVFAPLGVSPLHHVRDPKSKTNRTYREWFEDWMMLARAAGAETYYYDYEPLGYCWNMAMICPRWAIIGKNYPWFHELGLDGHTTQGYDDWASSGLNNYLMQRLYWDATLDYKDVMRDYCEARFGAAAEAMMAYYQVYEDRMDAIPDMYSNEVWDNHLILTPEVRARARAALAKAVETADTDRARAHVHTMVLLQESTDAMCDAIEHARATGDFRAAAGMMDRCWEVRDELNQHYRNFMNSTRLDENRREEFFSGGIRNQYLRFADRIDNAAASLLLPREWRLSLDTRPRAEALGYHRPETSVDHLDLHDVTICPDLTFGTQREIAAFFYRTEVDVPADFSEGERFTLFMPSVIARNIQIWVDGEQVMFDQGTYKDRTWRGPDYFWINYNHEQAFDLTGHLKPGERQTIAFRVYKSYDFGGTYRRMYLLAE